VIRYLASLIKTSCIERQKATRKLKRLKKLLSKADHESEEYRGLKEKVHRGQVDLNYTLYCPLGEKYTSLYKRTDTQDNLDTTMVDSSAISQGSEIDSPKPALWHVVEQCMADNTLAALREGRRKKTLSTDMTQSPPSVTANRARPMHKAKSKDGAAKHSKNTLSEAQAADSDEGFFEE